MLLFKFFLVDNFQFEYLTMEITNHLQIFIRNFAAIKYKMGSIFVIPSWLLSLFQSFLFNMKLFYVLVVVLLFAAYFIADVQSCCGKVKPIKKRNGGDQIDRDIEMAKTKTKSTDERLEAAEKICGDLLPRNLLTIVEMKKKIISKIYLFIFFKVLAVLNLKNSKVWAIN